MLCRTQRQAESFPFVQRSVPRREQTSQRCRSRVKVMTHMSLFLRLSDSLAHESAL